MATYAYLIDPEKQFETKSGTLNVAGKLRVFDASTDDPVVTYKDFTGTENEEEIELDNNGRAIVIADSEKAYRLEVYDRYGTLLWTTTPLWCQAGGGGASIARTDIVSSDGTVEITKTVVGSTTTFDLSTDVDDSTDLLEWIRCDGATLHDNGCYCPTYTAGTMEVGDHGVTLYAARYYHITGHIKAVKPSSAVPFYDDVVVHFIGHNVDTDEELEFQSFKLDADYSMAMDQVFEVSTDIISGADIELYIKIDNAEISGATFTLEDLSIHRVFSGMPALPGGAASKPWAQETFQPILTPGTGIEISEDNVISATAAQQQQADWAQANTGEVDYIKNKPDLGIYAEKTEVADTYQEKLIAGDNIVLDGNTISATAEPQRNADWNANSGVEEILNKPDLSVYATKGEVSDTYQEKLIAGNNIVIEGNTISATAEPQEQADWAETNSSDVSYIKNKPDLSIYATTGEVATGLESKQDVLTAGNNITIENNVISATSDAQVQSDWTQANSSEVDYIKNKPETVGLVAGNNITIQDNGYTLTISADAAPQEQSDWAETNSSDVSYIKNKPDLSIYATTSSVATELEGKQDVLTAGSNITINNNVISATAEPQVQSDWNETNSSEVDYIKNKPDLSIYATTSAMTTAMADKQDTLTAGSNITIENNVISATAAPQEQADWNETNSGDVSYIKNKPDLSIYATTSSVTTALADKQDTLTAGDNITITNNVISATAAPQEQADWNETNSSDVSYIKNKPVLSSAATKAITAGANISISETSTEIQISSTGGGQLEQVQSDWAQANSSDVSYIKNKPEIGNLVAGSGITITSSGSNVTISADAAQQEQADWNETNSSEVDYIKNKPDLSIYATTSAMTTALADKQDTLTAGSNITINNNVISATAAPQVNSDWNATSGPAEILNKPDLSVYATQTDLSDKQDTLTAGTNITIENNVISAAGGTQVNSDWNATSGPAQILNKPDLSQYATLTDLASKQDTLTAGTGISINQNNVISSTVAPQVNSDWTATSGVQEILHKPEQLQLVAGNGITIVEGATNLTITADGGSGSSAVVLTYGTSTWSDFTDALATTKDIIVEETATTGTNYYVFAKVNKNPITQAVTDAVFSSIGTATMPRIVTLTTASAWSRTNTSLQEALTAGNNITISNNVISATAEPQVNADWEATSGVQEILNKPDLVDIVAGPGITVDNPDGNTLRVSMAADYEVLLWSGSCLKQGSAVSLSESASNFEKIEIYAVPNPSYSFISSPQIFTYPGSNTAGAYLCPFMTTGLKGKFSCGLWTITNGTSFNLIAAGQTDSYPSQNWDNSYGGVVKIVGIHRIANN